MKTLNFFTAYSYLESEYGINMDQNEFISVGMIAYIKIGNKNTTVKGIILDVENNSIKLPCDVTSIEAVFADFPDLVKSSNISRFPQIPSAFIERYINYWKINESILYDDGMLLNYYQSGDRLFFDKNYKNVLLLYRSETLDEENLPFINDKEAMAIAAYCAYTYLYKQGIKNRDKAALELANDIRVNRWALLLERARTPEKVSQNDMDKILNVMTSWDRKMYGKSFKPAR